MDSTKDATIERLKTGLDWTDYTKMEEGHRYTRNGKNVQRLGRTHDLLERIFFFLDPSPPFHAFLVILLLSDRDADVT